MTKTQRDFINAAVSHDVCDAAEILCMGTTFSTFDAFREQIMEAAFSNRHAPEGREAHEIMAKLNDAICAESRAQPNRVVDMGNNETMSAGVFKNSDGTWTAMTFSQSKDFKTEKGARA